MSGCKQNGISIKSKLRVNIVREMFPCCYLGDLLIERGDNCVRCAGPVGPLQWPIRYHVMRSREVSNARDLLFKCFARSKYYQGLGSSVIETDASYQDDWNIETWISLLRDFAIFHNLIRKISRKYEDFLSYIVDVSWPFNFPDFYSCYGHVWCEVLIKSTLVCGSYAS